MIAEVRLWGRRIGAVSMESGSEVAFFQYDPAFAASGIEIAPLVMPLSEQVYSFPALARDSFHGLPGLLADSLPDRFGNELIDAWLATQGRTPESFSAVERLCYTGARGMGALEFLPALGPKQGKATKIEIDALVQLASEVLTHRNDLQASFGETDRGQALNDILRVGTSAGGARAKAVIAWNPQTHEVRSGQVPAARGFEYWLLKFDGVSGNRDKECSRQAHGGCSLARSVGKRLFSPNDSTTRDRAVPRTDPGRSPRGATAMGGTARWAIAGKRWQTAWILSSRRSLPRKTPWP